MKDPIKNRLPVKSSLLLSVALSLWAVQRASAANAYWVGTNGVSATVNWSDAASFVNGFPTGAAATPYNNASVFNYNTAVQAPGVVTVNVDAPNPVNGGGGVEPTTQTYDMSFNHTNGYHTVMIQPGVTLTIQAFNGTPGQGLFVYPNTPTSAGTGGGQSVGSGPYTNYTVFTGAGGSLVVNGGLRVEAQATTAENHYTILDMSGLDNFSQISSTAASARFQMVNGGTRSQALMYLAKTNVINNSSDVTIGSLGNTSSNSLPIGMYLGYSNAIITGSATVTNGSGNELALAIQGCTNGFLKFNPAFLGGPSKPVVYISGTGAATGNGGFPTVSGMMAGALIGRSDQSLVSSYGIADFTGGIVTWNVGQLHLGRAGNANTNATGVLAFDSGTITANDIWCGWQQVNNGGAGVGTINVGSSATLQVNNAIRLSLVTGTAVSGSAGTLNVNGGTLAANIITNGGGVATMNLTNATWAVAITPGVTSPANAVVTTLNTGGTTNLVSVSFASLPTTYPFTNRLVVYNNLGGVGAANMGVNFPSGGNYQGYVYNNAAANAVDLVVTNGASPSAIIWSGADSSGFWDIATTFNWTNGVGTSVQYHQLDSVRFDDTASGTTSVILNAPMLTPSGLLINNSTKTYSFGGSGYLAGAGVTGGSIPGGLLKQGTGTLILANTTPDTYLGGVTISGGILQVGNGATFGSGSLGPSSGTVANSGGLVINRPAGDTFAVANVISGAGGITNAGSGTLQLNSANTFTGPVAVNAGTLQLGSGTALGTTAGGTIIQNGATLELNGFNPGAEPITVQGIGAGSGAIVNDSSSGTPILTAVTLNNDTTFGGSSRWDLQATLNAGGHNVTAAYTAPTYSAEWRDLNAASVGNIDLTSGILGWVGSTTAGSAGTLTIEGGAGMKLYNSSSAVNLTKPLVLNDGSTIANLGGANNLISGPITFNGYGTIDVSASYPLTLSGPLSGSGTLYKTSAFTDSGTGLLSITGSSPAFSGAVLIYNGKVRLDGSLGTGTSSSITSQSGTSLAGVGGVNNGPVDISGGYTPGDASVAGTNTFASLTLEGSALMTNNLSSSINSGNSRVVVNGALTMNNSTIYINPIAIGSTLQNGIYTLMTYSGSFGGSLPTAQPAVTPSVYTITLSNATSLSPKQIQAIVSGASELLVWDNASGNAEWDVGVSANWSNTVTQVASDVFLSPDGTAFNDSINTAANPATTIDIGPSVVVSPSVLSNNSTVNYTFTGAGSIGGGASVIKSGSSTLTISNANSFTGPTTISGGTLLAASATALGGTSGTVTVTNGGTLDVGFSLGAKPIVVSGAGVGGNGAIVNNNGGAVFGGGGFNGLANAVTLLGDTTFGGTNRWDLGNSTAATLSTANHNYNLTLTGPPGSYREWAATLSIDTNLGNISITGGLEQGMKTSALGNPTNTVTIFTNSTLTFWAGSNYTKNYLVKNGGTMNVRLDGPNFNLTNTLEAGATFHSINNAKTMTAPVTLLGVANFICDNNTCTFSNVISGASGGFNFSGGSSQFAFAAANTYQGPTIIASGVTLALVGNGSVNSSTPIHFSGTDTNGSRMDVSGKTDNTLTLATGQTLEGSGKVTGALTVSANATVAPGTNSASPTLGAIGASGAVTLSGTTSMKIYNPGQNDVIQSGTSITYGGTLNLLFLPGTLAAGNSWKLFNAPAGTYSGSFTLSPATPGSGLQWDTSQLTVSGTLRIPSTTPPDFTSISVGGGNVTLSGTNGPANGTYVVVTSTNVAQALSLWVPVATNQFDSNGHFTWSTNIMSDPYRFYRLRLQQ